MKFKFLLFLLSISFVLPAQEQYSYISDKKFKDPTDLIGYNFRPSFLEIRDEREEELGPDEYSFGVTLNNLYVNGPDIKGVYSINNTIPTEYGYKLMLMNARDPTIQGHLKLILTKRARVEALVFKRSTKDQEMIFFQQPISKELADQEGEYFTDRWDTELVDKDSLWGMTITPFFRVHKNEGGVQERLQMSDSTTISFVEKIRIVDKTKKKKNKKNKEEEISNIELGEPDEENAASPPIDEVAKEETEIVEDLTIEDEELLEEEEGKNKKIKIIKEYFLDVRSILTYDDGTTEDKVTSHQIKKVTQREDEQAGPYEDRFQLEIETKKGDRIFLYLTAKKTISYLELNDKVYYMRGH